MNVTEEHNCDYATALERCKRFPAALKRQYGNRVAQSSESWNANVLTFSITGVKGRHFAGTVKVTPDHIEVNVTGDIPRFARWKVESEIRAAIKEAMAG